MAVKNPVNTVFSRVFLCLIIFFQVQSAFAATPLPTHDLNPLTLVYGLPLVSPARLPESTSLTVSYNVSNTINTESEGNEQLFIDGETTELNFIFFYPLSDKTQLRIRLPVMSHDAGTLDGFINDFHQAFGFPEGDRPDYPNNQFLFHYQLNGNDVINLDQATGNGAGDVTIDYAYQLYATSIASGSIWSSLKLPTGDEDSLNGSGRVDVAIWYAAENWFAPDWSNYFNLGLLLVGKADVIPGRQNSEVLFGTGGIEWQLTPAVALNVQLDFHSAFYQSKTTFLDDSVQISSGGHISLSDKSRIEIVVVEDIYVGASPDVTFQLGFSHLF